MELFLIILTMVVLLLLAGFFSGSAIALVHADKIRLHARASQGHRGSRLVLEMFQRPDILARLGDPCLVGPVHNLGHQDRGQYAQNDHYNHDLDQGETLLPCAWIQHQHSLCKIGKTVLQTTRPVF